MRARPEVLFLAIGAAAGIATIVVTPPFKGADEPAHLRRAFQLSEGHLLAERTGDGVGGFLPPSLRLRRPASGPRVFVDFRNTALYAPVPYLPHLPALVAGRAAGLGPAALLYAARLAGLGAALALVALAIRVTPIGKHVFLLLALMPMSVRQMSLVTADTVTNGASLLLLALCLRASIIPLAPNARPPVGRLALCSLIVSLAKIAYLPLALLYFLVPAARFGDRHSYWRGFLIVGGLGLAASAAWLWLIRDLYISQDIAPTADPGRQAAFILTHPLRYARVLLVDLYVNGYTYARLCLGYAGNLPHRLVWPHVAVVALVALLDGRRDAGLDLRARAVIVAVFVCTYVSVNTLNYFGWSPVGSGRIFAVQGRYYIPIAPLPFLLLSNRRLASLVPQRRISWLSASCAALFSIIGLRYLVLRWHGV